MSIKIHLKKLSKDEKTYIYQNLQFNKEVTKYNEHIIHPTVRPYEIVDKDIYLPFYWGLSHFQGRCDRLSRENYPKISTTFTATLRPLQQEVRKEAIKLLNKHGSCKLSLYTGAGKTITSIYLSCKIKLKTLIIVNRLVLMDQWKHSIEKVCDNPKIQILKYKYQNSKYQNPWGTPWGCNRGSSRGSSRESPLTLIRISGL